MYGSDVIFPCVDLATKAVKPDAPFCSGRRRSIGYDISLRQFSLAHVDLENCCGASFFGLVPIPC